MKHKTKQASHLGELTLGSEPRLSSMPLSPAILCEEYSQTFLASAAVR